MSALADWYDRKIIPHPLDTNDVSSLGSIPTGDITLEKEETSHISLSLQDEFLFTVFYSFFTYSIYPTCVQGLLYQMVVGTQGPPLQAFISAGLSPTQSPAPPPSLTPPRVRHTTSLFCTPGPHGAEH